MRGYLYASISVALLVVVGLSACGTTPSAQTQRIRQTLTMSVTLNDSGIAATSTTFHPGERCRFVVTNHGTIPHEFLIMPPDMAAMMSRMPMAQWRQQAWHATGLLEPGMMTTFDYAFGSMTMMQQGQCAAFGCYTDGYALMQLPITVRG